MSDLGRRLLIGFGVAVAVVVAIGYGFIASGIASPIRADRAVLDLPPLGGASATLLDDGRPVFIVNDPDLGIWVLDAQRPQPGGGLGVLVAWCPASRTLVDLRDGSIFAPNGEVLRGPAADGLIALAGRPAPEDASRVIVGSDTVVQGRAVAPAEIPGGGCRGGFIVHQPLGDETFDPSVAADQEPPGWIWTEGTLRVVEGEVRLCDGLSEACDAYAETIGIDPAAGGPGADVEGIGGRFIGRVRDGAIEGLIHVPDEVETS
jgi:hypothetical protein